MSKFFEIKEFIEEYPNHLIHCVIGARGSENHTQLKD